MRKLFFFAFLSMLTVRSMAQTGYRIVDTFHIASAGWWDYLSVNGNKLYVSHGTQVNILDKNTGDSTGVISGTNGVHGIAFNVGAGRGYTSNGRLDNVFVFDINSGKILDSVKTGKNPDAIMYEPYTKKIVTCNGASKDLSIIDPLNDQLVSTIPVGGKPETAVSDGMGKLFVNIEDKNIIAVVDLTSMQMLGSYALDGGEEPTGLAYDNETKRLFCGCAKLLVVVDAVSGKVVSKIPIGGGCDGVAFDKEKKLIFTANGEDGNMSVIKEISPEKFSFIGNVVTQRGARTITIDALTHTLYLPTASFEPNTPEGQRPKMIPGSFMVLVIR